jgi:hypothetical protein
MRPAKVRANQLTAGEYDEVEPTQRPDVALQG